MVYICIVYVKIYVQYNSEKLLLHKKSLSTYKITKWNGALRVSASPGAHMHECTQLN